MLNTLIIFLATRSKQQRLKDYILYQCQYRIERIADKDKLFSSSICLRKQLHVLANHYVKLKFDPKTLILKSVTSICFNF